ncbi:MAG: hypothetical protein ACP5F8_03105 [Candidatus Aenigmatarchaeota archaeon]
MKNFEIVCGICKKVLCVSNNEKENAEDLAKKYNIKKISISFKDYGKDLEYSEEFFVCDGCFAKLVKDIKLFEV